MTPDAGERRCREAVSGGRRERRRPPRCCERACVGGRYWVRTSDLFRVREARYRCANRPVRPRTRGGDGADDRIRTGDPHLGKVMLYQLSYVRTSAGPTEEHDMRPRPAAQMQKPHSVRGHRRGRGVRARSAWGRVRVPSPEPGRCGLRAGGSGGRRWRGTTKILAWGDEDLVACVTSTPCMGRGHVGDKKFAPGCRDRSSLLGAGVPVARQGCRGGRRGGCVTQGSLRGGAGGGEGRPLRSVASRTYVTPDLVQAPRETV